MPVTVKGRLTYTYSDTPANKHMTRHNIRNKILVSTSEKLRETRDKAN